MTGTQTQTQSQGMQSFAYSGKDRHGYPRAGQVAAWSREQAVQNLLGAGIAVLELKPLEKRAALVIDKSIRLSGDALVMFYRQLLAMYLAGIPLVKGIDMLEKQAINDQERLLYQKLTDSLERGRTLADSMSLFPRVFHGPHIAMIRAGEVGGFLDQVLGSLSQLTERIDQLQRKARSALTYPMFVLGAALLAVFLLFNFIMPQFLSMVEALHVALPWPTRALLFVAKVMRNPLTVPTLLAIGFGVGRFVAMTLRVPAARMKFDERVLRVYFFGPILGRLAIARAVQMLAALCSAGVTLGEALPLAGAACGNEYIGAAVAKLKDSLFSGTSMTDAMRMQRHIFPDALVAYTQVGETAGHLPHMLIKAGELFAMEAQDALDRLPDIIEPLIILLLGFVVGFIVVSVFVPLYGALQLT